MLGAVNDFYPLRKKIKGFYKDNKNFVYRSHPGYIQFSEQIENKALIGGNYAREINRAKIFFTTCSILKYPLLKYFEAPACKTLLLAPTFKELEDNGFIPGKHFVAISEKNFASQANYYLKNHTLEIRAKELVNKINNIILKVK